MPNKNTIFLSIVLIGLIFLIACTAPKTEPGEQGEEVEKESQKAIVEETEEKAATPSEETQAEEIPEDLCDDLLEDVQRDVDYTMGKLDENKEQLKAAKAAGDEEETADAESDIKEFEDRLVGYKKTLEEVKSQCE